ncbi:MAG: hypothetical protein KDJ52_21400 [Anaerolineae bacterium]|nr:hypothetical protein [Anaerolineae bacterium]
MFNIDLPTLYILGSAVAGIATIFILVYMIRKDWPRSKFVDIVVWAVAWAIGGAIVGMADNDIRQSTAIFMGALWGALIAIVQTSGWTLRKK